ncbi:MAG: monovalent cation/H+ antiporter subunit D family protein [Rhizobiales bacterium]|nr:monovalent cation/H+ antiporter subunit D family protein [Hyphomicrobiales bacterium]
MTDPNIILIALLMPALTALIVSRLDALPDMRDGVSILGALATFGAVLLTLQAFLEGTPLSITLFEVMPGLTLNFTLEPLGMVFATVASGLWIITAIYSVGYMRGAGEKNQTRFYICFALAITGALGIAFAGNLFTLFIFYEMLTVVTYPLVAHKQTPEARAGARTYISILLGTSIAFFLTAIIWTWSLTGTLEFTPGGILSGHISPVFTGVLLALFAFGVGKAALMPFHRWLPAAMVAPTPVSALLHAVAVVKAGVFTLLKIGIYIFGIGLLSRTGASEWLMWLAAASILISSIIALNQDNLKARLAYSTISQLAYVTLGLALANQMGVIGGALQIMTHALGKVTLFMAAGAIYVATHKTHVSELDGLGRQMPFTFAAFTIAALSIIGLPPLGGAWTKWYLMLSSAEAGHQVLIVVLMISSLLNVAYLLPISARGFFYPPSRQRGYDMSTEKLPPVKMAEAPWFCVVPLCITALGCIVLFFTIGDLYEFLLRIPLLPLEGVTP